MLLTVGWLLWIFQKMKGCDFILPAVAMTLVGAWVAGQSRVIGHLEQERSALESQIGKKEEVKSGRPSGAIRAVDGLAEGKASLRSELGRVAESRIAGMTGAEMMEALKELDALSCTEEERDAMERSLLGSLGELDPESVMRLYAERLAGVSGETRALLVSVLKQWAARDPRAAARWLDERIGAGQLEARSLDGRSEAWIQFEGAVIEPLLAVDVGAAAARLVALPGDFRREVLQEISFDVLSSAEKGGYTELVRTLVPAGERAGAFAHMASELALSGGFQEVGKFLDAVSASAAEREAAAGHAASSHLVHLANSSAVTGEEIDSMRAWLNLQIPGGMDRVTGKAMAEAVQVSGSLGWDVATEMVLDYQTRTGSDEVLAAFIEGLVARSNTEQAGRLIEKIRDPAIRSAIREVMR
jgi:hypothetical protein